MNRVVAVVSGIYGALHLLPNILLSVLPFLPSVLAIPLFQVMPKPANSLPAGLAQMAFGVVLVVFAYRSWNTPSRKVARYTNQVESDSTRFDVIPATAPISVPVTLFTALFAAVTVGGSMGLFGAIFGLLFVALLALLLLVDQRGASAGMPRSFRLGRDGIQIDGQWLRREDIHHLAIRNKFAGDVEIVYDADRGIPTGRLLGLAARKKLAAVAYRVEVESGGKAHVVAAGLDEVTARGITAEIGKTLELRA